MSEKFEIARLRPLQMLSFLSAVQSPNGMEEARRARQQCDKHAQSLLRLEALGTSTSFAPHGLLYYKDSVWRPKFQEAML